VVNCTDNFQLLYSQKVYSVNFLFQAFLNCINFYAKHILDDYLDSYLDNHMTHYQATLVSHTHWDRAWYCTFQEYRIRLVRLIDNLITILKNDPSFRVFMLDGQMSVLEDYLEVRPDRAAELHELCRSGRVQVGPWFVLADEFLVSPESLIRNLQLGRRMGVPFGGVMNIGYVPDGFGHIAQLPQILRGFGIDNAFFWRGMGKEGDKLGTEFEWCAPDNSCVTTILMPWGYHNVTNLGYGIHWGDTTQMEFNEDLALKKIARAIDKLTPMTNTNALLLMNGIDHAEAEPRIPTVVVHANEQIENVTIHHGTLAEHLARVREAKVELPCFEGEFRWGRYSEILQGVYSTRIHLKQENHRGEVLLERYLEPLAAMAWIAGGIMPEGTPHLINKAWHWLLLNHPHDDIYGSGIDEVHHEMAHRFSQSRQIADALIRDSMRQIARRADYSSQHGTPIIAYNPLGWQRTEIVEAEIDFEFDDPTAEDFVLVDSAGNLIPHQVIGSEDLFWMEVLKPNRKRRVKVLFPATIPACGYTTVYAQPANGRTAQDMAGLTFHERGAENQHIAFTIADDGGLTVTDKATGRTYDGLNHFTDVEDVGDEYTFCPLQHTSQTISTVGTPARIEPLRGDSLHAVFRISWNVPIPVGLTEDRQHRSTDTFTMPITSTVTIYADQPGLYITSHVENQAHDHKLSVVFPTTLRATHAYVDESFMVAERELHLPDSTGWVEDPTALMHQRTFTDLSVDEHGLAILNRGLPSVEVTGDGQIALTLLRCVGWLSRDDLWVRRIAAGPLVPTPGAQCIGAYTFEYAILPHAGDWRNVFQPAHNYNAPIRARRADTHPGLDLREMNITRDDPSLITAIPFPRGGALPDTWSMIGISTPELILSAAYRSTDDPNALIVRLYNITRTPVQGDIAFGFPIRAVHRVNMAEEPIGEIVSVGDRITISANPAEVVTLKIIPVR
jgi:mannosylglycerate hydrolase